MAQKKYPTLPERWSALLVTIMITSIVLIVAMILLERIIPYSKQIRNMQDSLQAYYAARSEVELWKLEFQKSSGTIRVLSDSTVYDGKRINMDAEDRIRWGDPVILKIPTLTTAKVREHVLVAADIKLPLEIKLYENDDVARGFGTSRWDPTSHLLTNFGGGVTFDLSGINTDSSLSLLLETEPGVSGKIPVEFVYSSATDENPFFGSIDISPTGSTNIVDAVDANGTKLGANSSGFLAGQNCRVAKCYMKIRLTDSLSFTGVKLRTNTEIPDLNAVLIADGLSENGFYHSRIIELIPVTQSI